jgi:hypothetical protein
VQELVAQLNRDRDAARQARIGVTYSPTQRKE